MNLKLWASVQVEGRINLAQVHGRTLALRASAQVKGRMNLAQRIMDQDDGMTSLALRA